MPTNTFHWADYLIFVLTLVISAAIGIWYAWKDKRKQNTSDFLLGGREMTLFPVTLSLMASFLSAILVLGVPTEIFYNGTMYWMISFSNLLTFPFAVHSILPVFHDLDISSAYEVSRRWIEVFLCSYDITVWDRVKSYYINIGVNDSQLLPYCAVCELFSGGIKSMVWCHLGVPVKIWIIHSTNIRTREHFCWNTSIYSIAEITFT